MLALVFMLTVIRTVCQLPATYRCCSDNIQIHFSKCYVDQTINLTSTCNKTLFICPTNITHFINSTCLPINSKFQKIRKSRSSHSTILQTDQNGSKLIILVFIIPVLAIAATLCASCQKHKKPCRQHRSNTTVEEVVDGERSSNGKAPNSSASSVHLGLSKTMEPPSTSAKRRLSAQLQATLKSPSPQTVEESLTGTQKGEMMAARKPRCISWVAFEAFCSNDDDHTGDAIEEFARAIMKAAERKGDKNITQSTQPSKSTKGSTSSAPRMSRTVRKQSSYNPRSSASSPDLSFNASRTVGPLQHHSFQRASPRRYLKPIQIATRDDNSPKVSETDREIFENEKINYKHKTFAPDLRSEKSAAISCNDFSLAETIKSV